MSTTAPAPAPTYLQIRERIFQLKPTDLGLAPTTGMPVVWGVVAELGYEVGTATLLALADGTTSLHYSTGGGLLGRGDYAPVAQAARALVAEAHKYVDHMPAADGFPLPPAGQVRFILLAYAGVYAAQAPESSLASGQHTLSPLFEQVHETLNQMRLLAEKRLP
jgi:hypothetical protein